MSKKITYLAADERFLRGIITTPTSDVVICDNLKKEVIKGSLNYGQGQFLVSLGSGELNLDDCVDRFGIELTGVT